MKQIAGVMLVAILLTLWAALPPEAGAFGGGGPGNKRCERRTIYTDPDNFCRRVHDCAGGCWRDRWREGHCVEGSSKCEERTQPVAVVIERAPCLPPLPNDPTCGCGSFDFWGIRGTKEVPFCS